MAALAQFWGYEFARHAVYAGLLVAVLGAVVGFFIVLRRMAFVAVGVSHAALGGVAIGVILGHSPVVWAIGFSIVVALGMAALGKRGVSEDTAMGIFFPASMAFGVVLMGRAQNWQRDLLAYLFGDILAVQPGDLWLLLGATVGISLLVAVFFKELLYISFDEESAHAAGVPLEPMRVLLLVICAVAVVVSIKVVGVVLVSAMLVIPAATSSQLTCRWQGVLAGAGAVGLAALLVGIWASYSAPAEYNLPTGPSAVLTAALMFAAAAGVAKLRRRREAMLAALPVGAADQGVEIAAA